MAIRSIDIMKARFLNFVRQMFLKSPYVAFKKEFMVDSRSEPETFDCSRDRNTDYAQSLTNIVRLSVEKCIALQVKLPQLLLGGGLQMFQGKSQEAFPSVRQCVD